MFFHFASVTRPKLATLKLEGGKPLQIKDFKKFQKLGKRRLSKVRKFHVLGRAAQSSESSRRSALYLEEG
jgi:hypothetical protein